MPVTSQGALFSALATGSFAELIGTEECEWLDFKLTGYHLAEPRQKWELAKDVSAFANARGGCIVLGVRTERETHQITDIAKEIRPVAKSTIDPQQYLDVIRDWCYPSLVGVSLHWYPDAGPDGIFVIEVPAQPPEARYVLVTRAIDENDRQLNAVMITRREGSRVATLSPGEVHRLVSDGLRSAAPAPVTTGAAGAQPDETIDSLEHAQQWEALPVVFLQALPSTMGRLTGFYEPEGIRGSLSRHVPVRAGKAGFNLRIIGDVDVVSGAFQFLGDFRRAIRIEPSGLFTVGLLATSDYLAWGTQSWTAPGSGQTFLNSIALVESVTEFFRFLETELMPHSLPGATWSSRVLCRRFDVGPICLRAGPPTMTLPMLNPTAASAADWSASVPVTNAPEADAFAALREFYALFGLPESAIPFAERGSISLEQLRAV